jgi:deoxyuridine 5'-triphosphate nucleotidohydrolase
MDLIRKIYEWLFPTPILQVVLLNKNAKLPQQSNDTDAGWDLYSPISGEILGQEQLLIPLGIAITVPPNTEGVLAPRSGLALHYNIGVMGGHVDMTYTDEVAIILRNFGHETYTFKKGDRIGQLIINKVEPCKILKVADLDVNYSYNNQPFKYIFKKNVISRSGGFGSTGK